MTDDSPRSRPPSSQLPPRKALPPFEALRAFDAIARLGGVRKAAEYLCRDHAVVSRHLRAIEDWIGTKLIQRSPGGAVLTEDGQRYHREIAGAMDIIASATVDIMKRGDNRCLHIRCMPGFALQWLARRLGEFEKANQGVDVELRPANRTPELLSHDTDIEIRLIGDYRPPLQMPANMRSVEIAHVSIIAVASREYLAANTPIRQPHDLLRHQLLHEEDFETWRQWLAVHGVTDEVKLSGPRLWQGHLTLDAARHGQGVAITNSLIAADDLGAGRLIEIGRGHASFEPRAKGIYHFIAKTERWDTALIRRFRQWLTSTVAKEHPELRAGAGEPT